MTVQSHRDDDKLITALIERWAAAIRAGDLEGVVTDHADDIVMFDVPPPQDGVRGIDAYRETWPPFFRWLAGGAVFDIVTTEVTAGSDVAFAHLLLRCGTPDELARDPGHRLRITLGLRHEKGRWIIAHEHHSFPLPQAGDDTAEQEVRSLHERWFDATEAKDLDAIMAVVADDVVSYEHVTPLQHLGRDQVREVCREGLDAGDASWRVPDLTVVAKDDLAVAWGLNRVRVGQAGGRALQTWSRGTRVFRRTGGSWSLVHQHLSYPSDPQTGIARTDLTP